MGDMREISPDPVELKVKPADVEDLKILKAYKMGQRENVEKDKSLEKTAALCWHRHVSWCCCLA